jgi:hypothetical protein
MSHHTLPLGELHEHRDNPLDYINTKTGNLGIRKEEKDKFGEVFTPTKLINDMLDRLPVDIWSNPNNKWLDPATGFGNFQLVVYSRLMTGLRAVILDPAVRSEHIIRNMIFMVEFNKANCAVVQQIFGTASNLCCSDFLQSFVFKGHSHSHSPDQQYNVIIGNPPFNADQKHEGKKGGGSNLWPKFVEKSLDKLLANNGNLVFVHPALWRKPPSARANTLFDEMVHKNYMSYLELHSKADGKRDFNAQTPYDFYCIQKRTPNPAIDVTTVKDHEGNDHLLDLSKWHFLPNHSFENIQKLLGDAPNPNVIFHRSQFGTDKKNKWVSAEQNETHRFPLIHSTPFGGHRYYWSSTNDQPHIPMFGVPKVIFGESGVNEAIIDLKGEYGLTQGAIALNIDAPIEKNGPLLKHALESEMFARIANAMLFSNFRIDWRMFLYFRPDFYKDPMFQNSPKLIKKCKRLASGRCEETDDDADADADTEADADGMYSKPLSMTLSRSRNSRKSPSESRRPTKKSKKSPIIGGTRKRTHKRRKYKK